MEIDVEEEEMEEELSNLPRRSNDETMVSTVLRTMMMKLLMTPMRLMSCLGLIKIRVMFNVD